MFTDLCKICGATFTSSSNYLEHQLKVNCGSEAVYSSHCALCGDSFTNNADHDRHREKVHATERRHHRCATCNRKFSNRGCLTNHSKTHAKRKSPNSEEGPVKKKGNYAVGDKVVPQVHMDKRQFGPIGVQLNANFNNLWTIVQFEGGAHADLLNYYATRRQTIVDQLSAFKKTHLNIQFFIKANLQFQVIDIVHGKSWKQSFDLTTPIVNLWEHNTKDYLISQLDNKMFDLHQAGLKHYVEWMKSIRETVYGKNQ